MKTINARQFSILSFYNSVLSIQLMLEPMQRYMAGASIRMYEHKNRTYTVQLMLEPMQRYMSGASIRMYVNKNRTYTVAFAPAMTGSVFMGSPPFHSSIPRILPNSSS